jgi:hypothetical protein
VKPLLARVVSFQLGRKIDGKSFRRSEYLASRIRGWGNFTAGFEVTQWSPGQVKVEYVHGDWARNKDKDQREATALAELIKYKARLDALEYQTELDGIHFQLFVEARP